MTQQCSNVTRFYKVEQNEPISKQNLILEQKTKTERAFILTVLEMDPRGPKNGRSKILLFLYSFGHTEAKKIPEIFFH